MVSDFKVCSLQQRARRRGSCDRRGHEHQLEKDNRCGSPAVGREWQLNNTVQVDR